MLDLPVAPLGYTRLLAAISSFVALLTVLDQPGRDFVQNYIDLAKEVSIGVLVGIAITLSP
jgi:hypothetical protein